MTPERESQLWSLNIGSRWWKFWRLNSLKWGLHQALMAMSDQRIERTRAEAEVKRLREEHHKLAKHNGDLMEERARMAERNSVLEGRISRLVDSLQGIEGCTAPTGVCMTPDGPKSIASEQTLVDKLQQQVADLQQAHRDAMARCAQLDQRNSELLRKTRNRY